EAFVRLLIRDRQGRVWPSQIRRLAPDLFFQEQIYRRNGEVVWLAPGQYDVETSRGPEYVRQQQQLTVVPMVGQPAESDVQILTVRPQRWVSTVSRGWYSGDHHIHGAGCAHYQNPTQGVLPEDMFRQISGEGLNVGCVLTWGPCFEYQRQFFRPQVDQLSRGQTLMKYDLEVSGFGSQALGHVCLLNLSDQVYPGSDGTKERGWPTWTTPVLRWAKQQGATTGFAHSASGLQIDPRRAAQRLLEQCDADGSGLVSRAESESVLLPLSFEQVDADGDEALGIGELQSAVNRVADELPNLAIPEMNSVGAMELPVAVSEGVCDFISAMDTPRIAEWNMWYHVLNCGFPLKAAGETDFPCMSGMAVGQGRSYVQLHTNPVEVLAGGRPIRASAESARWCQAVIRQLWLVREGNIAEGERAAALECFERAIAEYGRRAGECEP
ncbi:MAG: CehA/McbA family metallohydrolase, partial [Planctomyces sp.]